jgi:hypothetical protein
MKSPIILFIVMGVLSFGLGIDYGWKTNLAPNGRWANDVLKPGLPPTKTQEAFGAILAKSPQEIEQVDTATLNWACLGGLPGSESIDLNAAQARITKLAKAVKAATQSSIELERKKDKTAGDCPELRIAILCGVLERDYKIAHFVDQYIPDHAAEVDWGKTRPEDLLFQSALNNKNDPVFSNAVWLVAVGQNQELKYPIKLASVPGRLCAVWDDRKNRWFILPSAEGIQVLPEDQFRKTYPVTDEEIKKQNLYHEYTQPEVLAALLQIRGKVLEQTGMPQHATLAYAAAHRFSPDTPLFNEYLVSAIDSQLKAYNVDRKVIEDANPERFNLTPPSADKELRP